MNNQTDMPDELELIPTAEAARLLGISPMTLQMRRVHGLPPRYYKFGERGSHSHVRYSKNDVLQYLVGSLRDPGGSGRANPTPQPRLQPTHKKPSRRPGGRPIRGNAS